MIISSFFQLGIFCAYFARTQAVIDPYVHQISKAKHFESTKSSPQLSYSNHLHDSHQLESGSNIVETRVLPPKQFINDAFAGESIGSPVFFNKDGQRRDIKKVLRRKTDSSKAKENKNEKIKTSVSKSVSVVIGEVNLAPKVSKTNKNISEEKNFKPRKGYSTDKWIPIVLAPATKSPPPLTFDYELLKESKSKVPIAQRRESADDLLVQDPYSTKKDPEESRLKLLENHKPQVIPPTISSPPTTASTDFHFYEKQEPSTKIIYSKKKEVLYSRKPMKNRKKARQSLPSTFVTKPKKTSDQLLDIFSTPGPPYIISTKSKPQKINEYPSFPSFPNKKALKGKMRKKAKTPSKHKDEKPYYPLKSFISPEEPRRVSAHSQHTISTFPSFPFDEIKDVKEERIVDRIPKMRWKKMNNFKHTYEEANKVEAQSIFPKSRQRRIYDTIKTDHRAYEHSDISNYPRARSISSYKKSFPFYTSSLQAPYRGKNIVDYGAATGKNGAFGMYAEFPVLVNFK